MSCLHILMVLAVGLALTARSARGVQGLPTKVDITIEEVAVLRSPDGAASWHRWLFPTVAVDSRGWYYVAPMADLRSIGMFRPDGQFDRTIDGSTRDDTLSFGYVGELKMRTDTLIAVDRAHAELVLLPLTDGGEPVKLPLDHRPEGVLPLRDGGYATQAHIAIASRIGLPVHVLGSSGDHVRSFGRDSDRVSPNAPYDVKRHIAHGPAGSIFVTRVNRYRIEQWSLTGDLLAEIEKSPSWFAPWNDIRPSGRAQPRPTWFDSVRFDESDGLLWCIFHVADQTWPITQTEGTRAAVPVDAPTLIERHKVFDTLIEVIEVTTGRVVASKRVDRVISGYLNGGNNLYASMRKDDYGDQIALFQLTISPRGPARELSRHFRVADPKVMASSPTTKE